MFDSFDSLCCSVSLAYPSFGLYGHPYLCRKNDCDRLDLKCCDNFYDQLSLLQSELFSFDEFFAPFKEVNQGFVHFLYDEVSQ